MPTRPTRREFLRASAASGAGLVVGFHLPSGEDAARAAGGPFAPNAFVRITPDNIVTIFAKHLEMGQGIHTGLATILAEELDADWPQIRVRAAPADAARYSNLFWGAFQGTGNSSSIANSWEQLRTAGATARALLVQAAAIEWNVPATEIAVVKGIISHAPTNRTARFGAFAWRAATLPPPQSVTLKDPKTFSLVGTRLPRLDSEEKTDGSAIYALDVTRPNMLTALIARPPRFGSKAKSVDASAAKAIDGVAEVFELPFGVAVVAKGFWPARKAREALRIEWDDSGAEMRGSNELLAEYRALLDRPGAVARNDGDAEKAIGSAAKVFSADFEFPYLAHAPMEPLNCIVELSANRCEIWSGSQMQTIDQLVAARTLGLRPEQVEIRTMLAGGSFGRRAARNADVVGEAVAIAKMLGGRAPVRLVWTREDDIRGGRYRPLYLHRVRAGVDNDGRIVGWQHRIVGQPIFPGNEVDKASVQGAASMPYAIGNLFVDLHTTNVGVPVLWWRSVGSSHTAFATETMLDEIATATGQDPVALRMALLKDHPRHSAVLKLAADNAGWRKPSPDGRYRGIAVHEWEDSIAAQVAEIRIAETGGVKIERVVCAVDCGTVINPDIVRAQMEGGIGYGLGAALHNAITLTKGEVDQSNFHDYPPLRIDEMPAIEVHIVPSSMPPTGVGELGVPTIAPAVANAYAAASGRRVRTLPFER